MTEIINSTTAIIIALISFLGFIFTLIREKRQNRKREIEIGQLREEYNSIINSLSDFSNRNNLSDIGNNIVSLIKKNSTNFIKENEVINKSPNKNSSLVEELHDIGISIKNLNCEIEKLSKNIEKRTMFLVEEDKK